jgi:hypothetical protein
MTTQVNVILTDGTVVNGVNYRMRSDLAPPVPSAPASPLGGEFHIETTSGWIDLAVGLTQTVSTTPGAPR